MKEKGLKIHTDPLLACILLVQNKCSCSGCNATIDSW